MTFDCKPIDELIQLTRNIRHFHYLAADHGFGQTSAHCVCWVRGKSGLDSSIRKAVSTHFDGRIVELAELRIQIDKALILNIYEEPDLITLVAASPWDRDWSDSDFKLIEEIETALAGLSLDFLPKTSGYKRSFFGGIIVPATTK